MECCLHGSKEGASLCRTVVHSDWRTAKPSSVTTSGPRAKREEARLALGLRKNARRAEMVSQFRLVRLPAGG